MHTVKYLFFFLLGAIFGHLLTTFISTSNKDIDEISELINSSTPILTAKNSQPNPHSPDEFPKTIERMVNKEQVSSIDKTSSSADKSLSEKIVELEAKNNQLEQKYQRTKNRLMDVTLEKESLDESIITDHQMLSLIDDEFALFRRQYKGKQRDKIYEFHQQEEDLNWGYQMNVHISDFIQTHYNSNLVTLEGVACKIDSCELLVSESESGSWPPIMEEMRSQTWWNFTSTHSSSRFGDNGKNLYYLYLSN